MVAPALRIVDGGAQSRADLTGTQARSLPRDAATDHPGYGCTPQRLVGIFRDAEAGRPSQQCELFDDIVETDAHLRNLFEQRASAVAGKPRVIKAGGPEVIDAQAAEALGEALAPLRMTEILEHLLGFNRYGFACAEVTWDMRTIAGRDWIVPVAIECAPPRRFAVVPRTEEIVLINGDPPSVQAGRLGESLWPDKWLVIRRSPVRVVRAGLMRTAAWLALYKRYATRDWVVYSEKFGIPLPVVTYPEDTADLAKDKAKLIAENIGNDGAAVVPEGIEVNLVDASRGSDSSHTHGGLITHCNRELSKLINGSTLSNDNGDSGGASYALGDVHASVRWEAVQNDAERLQEGFRTQLSVPFQRLNGLDTSKPPLMQIQIVRDLDPRVRVEMAKDMLLMGVEISLQQLRQDAGFATPINAADAIKPPPTPPKEKEPTGQRVGA